MSRAFAPKLRKVGLLAAAFGFLLGGCAHEAHRLPPHSSLHPPETPEFHLQFVEADDEGWFWQTEQAIQALDQVRASIEKQDTIVVLYVHGWHHSAQCCDGNVEGFKETLRRLRVELGKPMYDGARRLAGADLTKPFEIVGIYVGWRGRSLPGLLDYATFWGRKAAAERVGRTDFQEFMARLQRLYDDHYALSNAANFTAPRFLGVVSIGHSFGGQVMLSGTSNFFESELQRVNPTPSYLRGVPAAPAPTQLSEPLRGFGDLVILVNPAVEAAAYQRIHGLSRGLRYSELQTPILLTLSADNDGPRHKLFEIGRIAGEVFGFKPHKEDARERELERQALGVYGPNGEQVTHRLSAADETRRLSMDRLTRPHESYCTVAPCSFDWYRWTDGKGVRAADTLDATTFTEETVRRVARFDFSQEVVFADVRMKPGTGALPYQPTIVASVPPSVIDGHNGMFSEPLMDFLIRYIGFTEAKKYLLFAQRFK